MKLKISKKPIGRFKALIKPKSKKIRVSLVIFTSLALFSAFPYFAGPGLSEAKPMTQYLNGAFQSSLFQENGLFRPAFPNLTFAIPIVFETVPNQNKIVVAGLFGDITWFENDETTTVKNTIIDLSSQVGVVWDGGLLGMTFHPRFDDPVNPANYMFVFYSSKDRLGGRMPENYTTQGCTDDSEFGSFLILERYTVDPVTLVADVGSRTKLIVNKLFGDTHRGGGMTFGDDGFLYLTTGDQSGWSKSQDIINGLDGGVLRLDVDMQGGSVSHPPIRRLQDNLIPGVDYDSDWFTNNAGPHPPDGSGGFLTNQFSGVNYYIPNDNPFSDDTPGSTTSLYGQLNLETPDPTDIYQPGDFYEEYYTIGNRSPHRLFKDRDTGTLYIGEVGLSTHEEVNVVVPGANFGWPIFEGNDPRPGSPCSSMFNNMPHEQPLTEFARADANSVTGGFVYRGTENPSLFGKYICADYGIGDEIFAVDINTGEYEILGSFTPENIISWGQDYDGELYMLNQGWPTTLYKLTTVTEQYDLMPQTLSATGAFEVSTNINDPFEGVFSDMIPTEGVVPYELIESFWSDGAYKQRWLAIPNGGDGSHDGPTEQIAYTENGDWDFPIGTVLIKHFELNTDKTDPTQRKKIETRFSIKGDDGNFYFLTYNWNEAETDAVLQEVGLDETIDITNALGQPETQIWTYPSQSQCLACHNQANKGGLGLKSRYLNSDLLYDNDGTPTLANQLVTLSSIGILDTAITDAQTPNILSHKAIADQTATIDERARSYLDLNCAYCHRPDNVDNRGEFDLRLINTIQETGLLTASALSPLGIHPDEEILFQGDPSKSILFYRTDNVNPNVMMPPLAKTLIDQPAVDLIETWIENLNVCVIRSITADAQGACEQTSNTYTQDLIITYTFAPGTGTLEVNGQSFPITGSPQTVTLTNLVADENPVNVTAFFTDDPDCTFTVDNAFTAPVGCSLTGQPDNLPDDMINLGLVPDAQLTTFTNTPQRGTPEEILFDPVQNDYVITTNFNEFGEAFESNLGPIGEEDAFEWRVDWDNPKYVNYITFGGSYPDQPQSDTVWKISYFFNGEWVTLDQGQGGWISSGIFEWGGPDQTPFIAEALRLQAYSDGVNDVESFHIRGRGGVSNNVDDSATTPKATLIQYVPLTNQCEDFTSIQEGAQSTCEQLSNTYTQDLIVSYVNPPATGTLVVNGQSFAITSSPQTVTLTNLVADENPVDVIAYFSVDPVCTFTVENAFTAPMGCSTTGLPDNAPDDMVNLGLVTDAQLSFFTNTPERGAPDEILFDPVQNNYFNPTQFNEFGEEFESNIGTVDEEDGFEWRVDWDNPKYINYITFGGAYPSQPQPNTMWKISYFFNGNWITLVEGQGGWIDSGIFEWGGADQIPIIAEALRVRAYSDGVNPVESVHLRGRGGIAGCCGPNPFDDSGTTPKATLIQYVPLDSSCGLTLNIDDYLYCNGTWKDGNAPDNTTLTRDVYVGNGTYIVAEDEAIEVNNFEVSIGAKVIIEQGGSIKVHGNLTGNGVVELVSTSTKYSSIIVDGTSTGSIAYKRHINEFGSNDLVSSPLKGSFFGVLNAANDNIFENPNNSNQKLFGPFNEATGTYEIYSVPADNSIPLNLGVGYRTARDSSEDPISGTTFTFAGEVETGNVDVAITTSGSSFNGWNLIGNPYPSYISFTDFFSINQIELESGASQGVYGFNGSSTGNKWEVLNALSTERLIAPGQGFFIKSKPGGGTISFTPSMMRTGNTDDFIFGRNGESPHHGYLRLEANAQDMTFDTEFYFNSNASTGLDPGYDASLFGGTAPAFSLYSHLVVDDTGTPLAIQALGPNDMNDVTIPLGLNASQGQNISISIAETDLPPSINIYLEDTMDNSFTLINNASYTFTAGENLSGTGRFYLRFESSALSTIDSNFDALKVITNTETTTIDILGDLNSSTDFMLYDLHGRLVRSQSLEIASNFNSVSVSGLSPGVYIVTLESVSSDQKLIQKVVIQ